MIRGQNFALIYLVHWEVLHELSAPIKLYRLSVGVLFTVHESLEVMSKMKNILVHVDMFSNYRSSAGMSPNK